MRRIVAVSIFSLVYLLFSLPWAFSQPSKSFSPFASSSRNNGNSSEPKRKTTTTTRPQTAKELEDILSSRENWSRLESKVKSKVDDLLKSVLPTVIRQGSHANLSSECQEAVVRTTFALRQLKGWALKILDATGKPPDGLLGGTISSMGSYRECLSAVAYQDVEETVPLFTGKYCTLLIRPPVFDGIVPRNFDGALREVVAALRKGEIFGSAMKEFGFLARDNAIRWGVCVPSPCSPNDVENLSQLVTSIFGMTAEVPRCEVEEKTVLKKSQIAVFGFFGSLVLLAILGTLINQTMPSPKSNTASSSCYNCLYGVRRFFVCFCVRSNIDLVLNSNPASSISCLHGIRCLTMIWIVYGHTYFYFRNTQTFSSLLNGYDGVVNNFYFTPMINFTFSVETFFFVSGLLVVYSKWPELTRSNGSMNIFVFLLRRYWRLTPMLAVIISLAIILPLTGDGPLWHEFVETEAENCEQRWWMNMLYFNNLLPYHKSCMVATWYLSTNMQLYVISILFLVPLYKYPRLGVILVFVIASLGIFITGAVNYIYDLAPAMMFLTNTKLLDDVVIKVYHKPYAHVGGFCVGVMLAYLIKRRKNHRIPPFVQAVIWLLALSLSVILLFGTYSWNRGALPNRLLSSIYAASHRTAWTLPLAWLVYLCVTGQADFLNRLLSWSGFIPLSNLSYACYLIHPLVIIYNLGSRKERIYYDHYNMAYLFCGNLLLTIGVSFGCCLLAELPFSNLEKLIFKRSKNESTTTVEWKAGSFKDITRGKLGEIDGSARRFPNDSSPNI